MLENVKQLNTKDTATGKSNLELLIEMLNSMVYLVRTWSLEAMSYGFPQKRERRYIVGVLWHLVGVALDQSDTDFKWPGWGNMFDSYMTQLSIDPLSIRRFLLPDGHPKLRRAMEELKTPPKDDNDQGLEDAETTTATGDIAISDT